MAYYSLDDTHNGLAIKFNEECYTDFNYVYIYYKTSSTGSNYAYRYYDYWDLANKTITIPSQDFYLYWCPYSNKSDYYGFSIDSITPIQCTDYSYNGITSLPNYSVEEISGINYPDSNVNGNTHGNNSIYCNKLWHYTYASIYSQPHALKLTNIYNVTEISGRKTWIDDSDEVRPESITIKLLQDGIEYKTTTITADDNWTYSFNDIPLYNTANGNKYTYTIEEETLEDYFTEYKTTVNGIRINFNPNTYIGSGDYLYIYYNLDDSSQYYYKSYHYSDIANSGYSIKIPANNFYMYWHTDSYTDTSYGFSIDSIVRAEVDLPTSTYTTLLPPFEKEELSGTNYPDSNFDGNHPYNNYGENVDKVWHYTFSDSKISFNQNIINYYKYTEISGQKTWIDDTVETRPDEITVKLMQNGIEYATTITSAAQNWEYTFTDLPIYDVSINSEYIYSIQEEPVENYLTEYKTTTSGLSIAFNDNTYTNSSGDYVSIYYEYNGKLYQKGPYYYGTWNYENNGVVTIPSNNFYLYWSTDNDYDNSYGFSISSITPAEVDIFSTGNIVNSLPLNEVEELTGNNYPDSAFDENHLHYAYGNNVKKLWHYTLENAPEPKTSYNIINKYMLMDLQGTKTWKNDSAEERPESITIKLLQDGVEYATTTTTAEDNWEYVFRDVPRYRENKTYYNYSIEEVAITGYYPEYTQQADGLIIKFNSNTNKHYSDQLYIYYEYNGTFYRQEIYNYGQYVYIPSNNFYLHWKTDNENNDGYYGFSIDSITQDKVSVNNYSSGWSVPIDAAEEISGNNYPSSAFDENHPHYAYGDNVSKVWHYTADFTNKYYYNTLNTKNLYTIEIQKQDFFSKEALPNVVFDLYEHTCSRRYYSDHDCELPDDNDCWTHVGNYTTDETGLLTLNDIYISNVHSETTFGLVETAPDGYYIPEGTYWEINIKSYDNGEISIKTAGNSANRVAFLKPFVWTGYNMGINKVDGRYVLENVKPLREVEVTKRIKASDINYHNGIPTFLFKLTGIDDSNTERTYYKQMQFTEEYVSANTDVDGYVSITETFENLISTTYTLSEETVGRYEVGSITDVEGGTATTSTVEFDLVNNLSGKATFTNEKYEDGLFSHNDFIINVIDNSNTIESIIITAETPVIEAWEDQGIYKVSNAYIEYDVLLNSYFSMRIKGADYFINMPIIPDETMEEIAHGAYYVGEGLIIVTEPIVVEDISLNPGIYCEMNPSDSEDFPSAYILMIGEKYESSIEFGREIKLSAETEVIETVDRYYKISNDPLTFEEMINSSISMQEGVMHQQMPIGASKIQKLNDKAYYFLYFINVIEDTVINGIEYPAGIYSRYNPADLDDSSPISILVPKTIVTEYEYEFVLDSNTEVLEELEDGMVKISNVVLTYDQMLYSSIYAQSDEYVIVYPTSMLLYKVSDCVYNSEIFIFVTEDTTIEGIDLTAGIYAMDPSHFDDGEYYKLQVPAISTSE